ncbi:MAG TPA: hypothetical protein VFZ00_11285 [Solirubrobacter sp.]|nr:hypothetical protein [Solirubrobacter sp.]
MYVLICIATTLIAAACGSTNPAPVGAAWTEDDTVALIRREWDACRVDGSEATCMFHVRSVAAFFPPTRMPLTACGALCNSNTFCNQGIVLTCRVCGFDGTCTTSIPQQPAP